MLPRELRQSTCAASKVPVDALSQYGSPPPPNGDKIFALHVQSRRHHVLTMKGINIALELLHAILGKGLGEMAQRAEAARVGVPYILCAAVIDVVNAFLEFQIESPS